MARGEGGRGRLSPPWRQDRIGIMTLFLSLDVDRLNDVSPVARLIYLVPLFCQGVRRKGGVSTGRNNQTSNRLTAEAP